MADTAQFAVVLVERMCRDVEAERFLFVLELLLRLPFVDRFAQCERGRLGALAEQADLVFDGVVLGALRDLERVIDLRGQRRTRHPGELEGAALDERLESAADRKSTRLNSSHGSISYAVFCLKKKK